MLIAFILYSRSYCHLCDDMHTALDQFSDRFRFTIETLDVDADPVLLERYDEKVPVLVGRLFDGSLQELCHYFLDIAAVEAFLCDANAMSSIGSAVPGDRQGEPRPGGHHDFTGVSPRNPLKCLD